MEECMNFYRIFAGLCVAALTGCGAFVPVQSIDKTGIDVLMAASKLPIVSSTEVGSMQDIGEVIGYSCMNKATEVAATKVGAIDQAKIVATQRGARAITNLTCSEGGVSLIRNCWQSWECKATALQ